MLDFAITWALQNPLPCVGLLVGLSVAVGLLLVPSLYEVSGRGHPRC